MLWESEGSTNDSLIRQAIRQNVKGSMVRPLNVIQWVSLTLSACNLEAEKAFDYDVQGAANRLKVGGRLTKAFDALLAGYDNVVINQGLVINQATVFWQHSDAS